MKSEPKSQEWIRAPQMDTGAPLPSTSVRDDDLYLECALPDGVKMRNHHD
jgi:hypothetical protein